jgi:hypothetical protein
MHRGRRFDLLHIMIDEPHDALDYQIASHIVGVHMRRDAAFAVPYDMRQVQRYLKYARAFRPEMTPEVRARGGRARGPRTGLGCSTPAGHPGDFLSSRGSPCEGVSKYGAQGVPHALFPQPASGAAGHTPSRRPAGRRRAAATAANVARAPRQRTPCDTSRALRRAH